MTLPVLLAHVAARWAATRTPTCGWVPDESETDMPEHETSVTDGGRTATCTCGWYSRWAAADGSAYEDAAGHKRHHAKEEA